MLTILDLATFAWLAFWALFALYAIASGSRHSILFLIIVHFMFSGLPLLLDVLFGPPVYLHQPGFRLATRDEVTSAIYCFYVGFIPPFWWITGRAQKGREIRRSDASVVTQVRPILRRARPILYLVLICPLILAVFAPNPRLYAVYGAAVKWPEELSRYHNLVALSSLLSIVAAAGLLAAHRRLRIAYLAFLFPWLVLAIWLNGKRSVLALVIVLFGYLLWSKGYLRRTRLIMALVVAMIIFLGFSHLYQSTVRTVDFSDNLSRLYSNMRIDYGRDDVIKMTIFAELHPETMRILEYRGQSLLFDIAMYVPRKFWPEKPLPYNQYFTSAMLMHSPRMWGWGMTTSWLEEAIANFSWLGMIVGPLALSLICRVGDACQNDFVSALTVLIGSLLLAVNLTAFAPLFLLWAFTVLCTRRAKRKTPGRTFQSRVVL